MIRGGCSFEDKVRMAQNAGYKAAIVYDNEDGGILVASNDQLFHSAIYFFSLSFSLNMQLSSNLFLIYHEC
jgi:hypothetical protein